MIVLEQNRQITESGVKSQTQFKLHHKSQAHLMHILRNSLYPHKILAVLREYASNAWDSHRQSGKGDVPIKITLPTMVNPTLTIRDFGSGMSSYDMKHIFPEYGASTKRKTNLAVGMLGIGCKSGFCYSDSFTVTSWHKGRKMIYVAVMDQSNEGSFKNLLTVPCDKSETGLEISLPVKPQDIDEFHNTAKTLFSFFQPPPEINCTLHPRTGEILEEGFFQTDGPESEKWVALMGCVPYKVNIHTIEKDLTERGLWHAIKSTRGGVFFDIGEIQISANREELEYTDITRTALVQKFTELVGSYLKKTLGMLTDDNIPNWDKRLKASHLSQTLGLTLPDKYGLWATTVRKLTKTPTTYYIAIDGSSGVSRVESIRISPQTRFIYKDIQRALSGFDLGYQDYVIYPLSGRTLDAVRVELAANLKHELMDGVPICNLSDLPWQSKSVASSRSGSVNPKHKVKSFKFAPKEGSAVDARSRYWDIEDRVPQEDDVFVILDRFEVPEVESFYSRVGSDEFFLKRFGVPFPEIYGYKTTWDKPILSKDCTGMMYSDWRALMRQTLQEDPNHAVLVQNALWLALFPRSGWHETQFWNTVPRIQSLCLEILGERHPLAQILSQHLDAREFMKSQAADTGAAYDWLVTGMDNIHQQALRELLGKYPLLRKYGNLKFLDGDHKEDWLGYIKMVDLVASLPAPTV